MDEELSDEDTDVLLSHFVHLTTTHYEKRRDIKSKKEGFV